MRKNTRISWVGKAILFAGFPLILAVSVSAQTGEQEFNRRVELVLPEENLYDYHKRLSEGPVHFLRRDPAARPASGEIGLPERGWNLVWNRQSSPVLETAVRDFEHYLRESMQVQVKVEGRDSLAGWDTLTQTIVVGTRDQLPGCGAQLSGPKDYQLIVSPERVTVCGYDERGSMYGLYNLEARMNLREGPFLPGQLNTVRHSLYNVRMVHSWMGWMEWPDSLLSHLAHDGFDAIFASVYANPNGDRTTAESSTDFYARLMLRIRDQDPARMHDLIKRAKRFGLKVYTPIIYQYLGTEESEAGLRKLVRDIVRDFPEIQGYVLLTEGFWYKRWGGGHGADEAYMRDWAENWNRAVGIVAEECHRVNPATEVLPWEYNIDFRPENAPMKRYFIQTLPRNTMPLLTWENGKSFEIDGFRGYLRDYSLNQVGPAEVTEAQIEEANKRGTTVYSKVDTFASWQFGTIPYLPCPYQWYARYQALEKYGVKGTLESWSSGYKPNFISEIRAWTCWSDSPPLEDLLRAIARRDFGPGSEEKVVKAWDHFSQAIRYVPDTGPNFGTNNAVGNPIFLQQPHARTATFYYSWQDQAKWMGYLGGGLNPYWPFTYSRMVFYPDFTNQVNKAEQYARSASGIGRVVDADGKEVKLLPLFMKYLLRAADELEAGLKLYREAALQSPESKRERAFREVIVAEQIQRMLRSNQAILEFEDLRLQLAGQPDSAKVDSIVARMESIVRDEIARTEFSLIAAKRDSRLGFQYEQDYVYTPYSLSEKLGVLKETLEKQIPELRRKLSARTGE
jgi:hypothetical protein